MPADPKLVRDYFLAAAELPAGERATFLAANCGGDGELRTAVERLRRPRTACQRPQSAGTGNANR